MILKPLCWASQTKNNRPSRSTSGGRKTEIVEDRLIFFSITPQIPRPTSWGNRNSSSPRCLQDTLKITLQSPTRQGTGRYWFGPSARVAIQSVGPTRWLRGNACGGRNLSPRCQRRTIGSALLEQGKGHLQHKVQVANRVYKRLGAGKEAIRPSFMPSWTCR